MRREFHAFKHTFTFTVSVRVTSDHPTPDELLLLDVEALEEQYATIVFDNDNAQQRNRKAIELHYKLYRATEDVCAMRSTRQSRLAKRKLRALTTRLLVEVFGVRPENIKEKA